MRYETVAFNAVALAALAVSARWNWWRLPQRGIPILMYHKVGLPPAGSRFVVFHPGHTPKSGGLRLGSVI